MIVLFLILLIVVIRVVETYFFIKKVSKVCYKYDWKCVNENDLLILDMLSDDYMNKSWSAYNFLFLKGPSPLRMFLSLKPLTIERQYNEEAVNKLKKHEII